MKAADSGRSSVTDAPEGSVGLLGPFAAARAADPIIDPDDLRGTTFSVEDSIYPEGTIESDGFDPESAETIGRWLCRG